MQLLIILLIKGVTNMKNNNRILLIVLAIGILTASVMAGQRVITEGNNKTVDVVLEYREFEELAKQSAESLQWWFEELKGQGARYVAIQEENLFSLQRDGKPIKLEMGGNLIKEVNWKEEYPQHLVEYIDKYGIGDHDVVAITDSKETYDFIAAGLTKRYPLDRFKLIEGSQENVVIIKGTIKDALFIQGINSLDVEGKVFRTETRLTSSKLTRLSLGIDPEKVNLIKASGLEVMPRPYNYQGWIDEKFLAATLEEYEGYGIVPEVFIFDGDRVLGYPGLLNETAEYMRENNIKVALIENSVQREHLKQEGLIQLTEALDYNAVRVFSIWEYIQERFKYYGYEGAEEIENTLYRAVTERNIRMIFFKPFKLDKTLYVTDIVEYQKLFDRFKSRISEHGMQLGASSALNPVRVRVRYMLLMAYGIVAAALLLLRSLIKLNKKHEMILLALGILGTTGVLFVMPALGEKVLALVAGIVFASLGIVYFFKQCKVYIDNQENYSTFGKRALIATKDLVLSILIAGIGALFIASILSDIRFLLELDIFRGVKISQLLPMAIYILLYLAYFGYNRKDKNTGPELRLSEIKQLLVENIKFIHIIIGVVIAIAGIIYISRTGHETNIQPTSIEIMLRNLLEERLMARPRNKEFMIGFPALFVGFYCAQRGYKKLVLLCGLAGTVALASMINTFSHLRTPLYLSTLRTIYAAGIGLVIGIIGIVVLDALVNMINKYTKNSGITIK